MSTGTLEITVISAAISPHAGFDAGPKNTYAVLKCIKEQRCTKIARDQGRLPAWNETFTFNLQEQDMAEDIVLQVFGVRTENDELLGLARIPILNMIGKEEAMLCALISPSKGETGKLKAAWNWKPDTQRSRKATNFEGKASEVQEYTRSESYTSASFDSEAPSVGDCGPVAYPHHAHLKSRDSEAYSKLDAVSDALAKLTVDKGSSGRSTPSAPPYPEDSIGAGGDVKTQGGEYYPYSNTSAFGAYPTEHIPISEPLVYSGYPDIRASSETREEISTYSSPVYSRGPSDYSYPPPPADVVPAYPPYKPPYSGYQSSTTEFSHDKGSTYPPYSDYYKQSEALAYTERGVGSDSKEKGEGHGSRSPYGQPPPAGYPPSSYPPPPSGYPPSSYPPPYGYPPEAPSSYPPPYGYPPEAAHGYPPASSLDKQGEAFAYTERGVGGDTKEKGKGHGSHSPYGQAPPAGYPPSSYPPPPPGYPPSSYPPPYSHPPEAAYGYPPAPHGYPPAPQGYPPAPYGYPPAVDHHSGPSYPPYGYPPPAYGGHQVPYPVDHGHGPGYAAAGAYVGHSSSGSKTSKKHKEPKHSSSHHHGYAEPHYVVHGHHNKHNKHKKHKSFKGLKFKKFKKFKF